MEGRKEGWDGGRKAFNEGSKEGSKEGWDRGRKAFKEGSKDVKEGRKGRKVGLTMTPTQLLMKGRT